MVRIDGCSALAGPHSSPPLPYTFLYNSKDEGSQISPRKFKHKIIFVRVGPATLIQANFVYESKSAHYLIWSGLIELLYSDTKSKDQEKSVSRMPSG